MLMGLSVRWGSGKYGSRAGAVAVQIEMRVPHMAGSASKTSGL